MEVRILNPSADGVGEVAIRSKTVMAGYLNDPELTGGDNRRRLASDRRSRPL